MGQDDSEFLYGCADCFGCTVDFRSVKIIIGCGHAVGVCYGRNFLVVDWGIVVAREANSCNEKKIYDVFFHWSKKKGALLRSPF